MWKQRFSVAQNNAATRAAAVQDACRAAARTFWCLLDEFVRALPRAQREWDQCDDMTEAHPFIALVSIMPRRYKLVWPEDAAVGPQPEFDQPPV